MCAICSARHALRLASGSTRYMQRAREVGHRFWAPRKGALHLARTQLVRSRQGKQSRHHRLDASHCLGARLHHLISLTRPCLLVAHAPEWVAIYREMMGSQVEKAWQDMCGEGSVSAGTDEMVNVQKGFSYTASRMSPSVCIAPAALPRGLRSACHTCARR